MPVTYTTATHTGLVRRGNEDAFFAHPPVFAVADGMGGAQAGEVASGMAVSALKDFEPREQDAASGLSDLIRSVNRSIYEQAVSDAGRAGMGTTLTAAVVTGSAVEFAHVGDSRAYLWRNGELRQLTEDHSLVGEMIRQGRISEAEAEVHPQRSIITRALGVEGDVEIDSLSVDLRPGDLFLLSSDGLHSLVSDGDIAAILAGSEDLAGAAGALVEAANAAGGNDNITVVLFSPDGSAPAGAEPATAPVNDDPAEREGGPAPDEGGPGRRWLNRTNIAVATAIVLIIALVSGSWYGIHQVYYLDFSDDRLSIYQGLPLDLGPVSLSGLYRQSDVRFDDLEPFEQERVSRQDLRTLEDAEQMLENYIEQARDAGEADSRGASGASVNGSGTSTSTGGRT